MTATGLVTVLLKQIVLLGYQVIAIHRTSGGAIMNAGIENVNLRQPNQVFTARDPRYVHRRRQFVGGKLHVRVGINPLTEGAQRLGG